MSQKASDRDFVSGDGDIAIVVATHEWWHIDAFPCPPIGTSGVKPKVDTRFRKGRDQAIKDGWIQCWLIVAAP